MSFSVFEISKIPLLDYKTPEKCYMTFDKHKIIKDFNCCFSYKPKPSFW